MLGFGLIVWVQVALGLDGGVGLTHRIPVPRERFWVGVWNRRGGEIRRVGPHAYGGFTLRYLYRRDRFIESGGMGRWYEVGVGGRRETFFAATVPIRWGARIDTTGWWVWGGLSASFLLQVRSRPDSAQVYRFADYFNRSQLHLQAGIERLFMNRWGVGLQVSWDLSSAWDRVLYQDSQTLARHFHLTSYLRYTVWNLQ
ncbi:MAG: hypothetical protein N3E49_08985 [Bacteroidia bacterium]|nr:hypothetical protein [Bacteroidia bacterium]